MTDDGEQVRKYRERADELRAMVHGMTDQNNIKAALSVADNYEHLAKRIEGFAAARKAESVARIRRALASNQ